MENVSNLRISERMPLTNTLPSHMAWVLRCLFSKCNGFYPIFVQAYLIKHIVFNKCAFKILCYSYFDHSGFRGSSSRLMSHCKALLCGVARLLDDPSVPVGSCVNATKLNLYLRPRRSTVMSSVHLRLIFEMAEELWKWQTLASQIKMSNAAFVEKTCLMSKIAFSVL